MSTALRGHDYSASLRKIRHFVKTNSSESPLIANRVPSHGRPWQWRLGYVGPSIRVLIINMQFSLWFNDHFVGDVRDCFLSDGVWYGKFAAENQAPPSAVSQRLAAFVSFCESWNEQLRAESEAADASQFESFSDVVHSGNWFATDQDGTTTVAIEDAPMFFAGNEISFRSKS